jgi:Ca-activated chloride channel family protein
MRRSLLTALCLVLLGLRVSHAQSADNAAAAQNTTVAHQAQFKSAVALVALDVCVKNRDGNPTQGLQPEDFLILENEVPQRVALFGIGGHVPLAVALLVDNSRSMFGEALEQAKVAAARFIDILRPDDLVEVMSFNERANLRHELGPDHDRAKLSLRDIFATGATRLYETVLVAVRDLERAQRRRTTEYRNVIIVLSDGEDTHSRLPFDDVLEEVRRSGVLVYTISLRTRHRAKSDAPLWQMNLLAYDTGGRAIAIHDLAGLTKTYEDINTELINLYRIGYVPSNAVHDGSWRSISIRVPSATLVVRARSGYYAPRFTPAVSRPSTR